MFIISKTQMYRLPYAVVSFKSQLLYFWKIVENPVSA
jgi:hypothetical protein